MKFPFDKNDKKFTIYFAILEGFIFFLVTMLGLDFTTGVLIGIAFAVMFHLIYYSSKQ
jgi:MFS superfamily sulfate permease-like transporter